MYSRGWGLYDLIDLVGEDRKHSGMIQRPNYEAHALRKDLSDILFKDFFKKYKKSLKEI